MVVTAGHVNDVIDSLCRECWLLAQESAQDSRLSRLIAAMNTPCGENWMVVYEQADNS